MIFVGTPGENLTVFQPGDIMEASAVKLFDRSGELRNVLFAVLGVAPDNDLPLFGDSRDSGAGGCDVHDFHVFQFFRDSGKGGTFVFESGVGNCTVFEQADIFIGGQRYFGDFSLILFAQFDIGQIGVSPEVKRTVGRKRSGKLVAGFQLDDVPSFVRVLHAFLHLTGEVTLLQSGIAPDVKLLVFIHRNHMVVTGGEHDQIDSFHFVRDVGNVNLFCDLGVPPGVDLAVCVNGYTIGTSGSNVADFAFQRGWNVHHVVTGRQIDKRRILFGKVQYPVMRADENKEKNQDKPRQTDADGPFGEKVFRHGLEWCFHLFFLHDVFDFLCGAMNCPFEPAGQEKFVRFSHFLIPPSYLSTRTRGSTRP